MVAFFCDYRVMIRARSTGTSATHNQKGPLGFFLHGVTMMLATGKREALEADMFCTGVVLLNELHVL
jgi:hypothetical protein